MKGVAIFSNILILILTLLSTSGQCKYHDEDRHVPPFLPPFLRYCPCSRELRAIDSRCSAVADTLENIFEESIGEVQFQIAALTNLTLSLFEAVNNLTNQLSQNHSTPNTTKCPASSPSSSKVVGSLCYSINTTSGTFQNANASCHTFGGTLAEPLFANSTSFYISLKTAFPNEVNLVGVNGELWIGLLQPASATPATTPFAYLSNSSLTVLPTSNVFSSPPTVLNVPEAVVFVASPGSQKWKFYNILSTPPTLKPYICQYKLV